MKVFLDTVGCKLNQSEIEKYSHQFNAAGHQLVQHMSDAEIIVVNTCAVTSAAASDSRQKLRQALKNGPDVRVVATGCLASIDSSLAEILPGLNDIITNDQKDQLVEQILSPMADVEFFRREPISGSHARTRSFIKAQDGCNNFCTFCITRLARGKARSIPAELVKADIQTAIGLGVHEVVLTGVHLGSWGTDLSPELSIKSLIQDVLDSVQADIRIRVSSLEPWDLTPDLFDLWRDSRLCKHFHLPVQSGSNSILKRMARHNTAEEFANLVKTIRERIPDAGISTDMIVGFPGETDAEFDESLQFVNAMNFSAGHVFHYSARQGTPAAKFPNQVHGSIKQERSRIMRAAFLQSAQRFHASWVGKDVDVLWEADHRSGDGWRLSGLTGNYLRVNADSDSPKHNQVQSIKIIGVSDEGCIGEDQRAK